MPDEDRISRRSVLFGAGIGATLFSFPAAASKLSGSQSAEPGAQGQETAAASRNSQHSTIRLERIGGYSSGYYDGGGAEIVDYDSRQQQALVANSAEGGIDILDISDPTDPTRVDQIDVASALNWSNADEVTSVAVKDGIVAAGIANETKTDNGRVATVDTNTGEVIGSATVGALPDAVKFTPDRSTLLVANEGEPSEDYETNPEGSVSVVSLSLGGEPESVETAGFSAYDGQEDQLREQGIRIFGPTESASQNMEPENVTISPDGSTAWVAIQEANALAVVDIDAATVTDIHALGYKDHMLPDNGFDASDEDGGPNIRNWPTKGMYQPDGMDSYEVGDETFVVTANEGDSRDYDAYSEETEVSDLDLDAQAFDFDQIAGIESVQDLQDGNNLGELETTTANGDIDGDGQHEEIYSYGARSFSIWDEDGNQVFDSGNEFEKITAERYPDNFNNDNDETELDSRSDAKGPEPEGVSIGEIGDKAYAFIGLERMSGIMVYDITSPENAEFVQYINPRDFSVDIEDDIIEGSLPADAAGDVGTESVKFVSMADSPVETPLVLTANEGSGTTGVFKIELS